MINTSVLSGSTDGVALLLNKTVDAYVTQLPVLQYYAGLRPCAFQVQWPPKNKFLPTFLLSFSLFNVLGQKSSLLCIVFSPCAQKTQLFGKSNLRFINSVLQPDKTMRL